MVDERNPHDPATLPGAERPIAARGRGRRPNEAHRRREPRKTKTKSKRVRGKTNQSFPELLGFIPGPLTGGPQWGRL